MSEKNHTDFEAGFMRGLAEGAGPDEPTVPVSQLRALMNDAEKLEYLVALVIPGTYESFRVEKMPAVLCRDIEALIRQHGGTK